MTAAPKLASALKLKISISSGESSGQNFEFEKSMITIGRGPENDMVFSSDPKMSRAHAEIRIEQGQVQVRNVSQKNFIYVNGDKTEEKIIKSGVILQVGDTKMKIQFDEVADDLSQKTIPIQIVHSQPYIIDERASAAIQTPVYEPPPLESLLKPSAEPQAISPQAIAARSVASSSGGSPAVSAASPALRSPPPPPSQSARPKAKAPPKRRPVQQNQSGRIRFYAIIAVVGIGAYLFLSDENGAKKPEVNLRTEGDVARAIEESALAIQEIKKQSETKGQDSLQFRAAQEHYIKGFRDYRQGQYARAMQSFQAALSFYPSHELARKYLLQSQRKFEAQIDFHMSQGRKYYQKQNFKMCQSSFASVMMMVKDSARPKYKEAKQFYDECNLRLEGRF